MTDNKTALLEKEIARLNLIIDALAFENAALKRGYSVSGKGNAPEEFGYSVAEKGKGITEVGYSVVEKSKGITEVGYSVVEKGNGITEVGHSVAEKGNGITEVGYSVAEKDNGITDVRSPVSEKGNGITEPLRPLPERIDPASGVVYKLNQKLRAMEKGKVKRSGSINSAKLLVHFHNKSNSDHPTLRKLTGLSEGGLGKLIMSLKKRGLIVRDGWQKFALTPAAKKLLSEAVG
jgi:hypothetical protein